MFAAFIWFEFLIIGFGFFLAGKYVSTGQAAPGADALASLAYIVTPLAVVASIYWARAKLADPTASEPPAFTRDSIVAMGIAELGLLFAAIAFMRSNPWQILVFGGIVMMIDFLIILRAGLRYWAAREAK
jgi:hypothetical protein